MPERQVAIQELEANPNGCIEEVRNGMTLVVTDGGNRVARVIPEVDEVRRTQAALDAAGIARSGRRPKKRKPSVVCGGRKYPRHRAGEPLLTDGDNGGVEQSARLSGVVETPPG